MTSHVSASLELWEVNVVITLLQQPERDWHTPVFKSSYWKAVLKVITWKSSKLSYISRTAKQEPLRGCWDSAAILRGKRAGEFCAAASGRRLSSSVGPMSPCSNTEHFACSQFSISQETQILKYALPMHIYTHPQRTHPGTERKGEGPPPVETVCGNAFVREVWQGS